MVAPNAKVRRLVSGFYILTLLANRSSSRCMAGSSCKRASKRVRMLLKVAGSHPSVVALGHALSYNMLSNVPLDLFSNDQLGHP
jgi:hypothetical protein